MTPTELRNQSCNIAKADAEAALKMAMAIEDPWFSCQALAWGLRYASRERISEISELFIGRSKICADAFQQSAVQAWLVRALAERDFSGEATKVLDGAKKIALNAEPESSKSESLFTLFQAAFPLGAKQLIPLSLLLREGVSAQSHWRCRRNLADALAQLSQIAAGEMGSILASCDERIVVEVKNRISDGLIHPREFFW